MDRAKGESLWKESLSLTSLLHFLDVSLALGKGECARSLIGFSVYEILMSTSLPNPVLILTGSIIKLSSHHF